MEGTVRKHPIAGMRVFVVSALAAFGALVPTASADTALPVWTCRASAAYVEIDPLLGSQRVEPVLANGFPDRAAPDRAACGNSATGVQNIAIPAGAGGLPLVTLNAASASTTITPEIAAARNQAVTADSAIAGTIRITLGGLDIEASAVTAEANGSCAQGQPVLTSSSTIVSLRVNGTTVEIPQNGAPVDITLPGLVRVRLNQTIPGSVPATQEQSLTQRAAEIELLTALPGEPLARVVLGEAKVDLHGPVCAPAVVPSCPAGYVANPGSDPLTCIATVTAPCPAGSTADPNAGGACVITKTVGPPPCPAGTTADPNAAGACIRPATPAACPSGTTRDPKSQACILLVQRPCPPGSTPDPATQVCVLQVVKTTASSGENGRVGSPTGPKATCGRLDMHFVRGPKNAGRSLTSQFGTRTVTRGRLVTCGSKPRPIVGARIDVVHVLPNGQRRRKTGLRSRAAGRLTLILPIDLRTRKIDFAYRPNLNTTRVTSRVILRLTVSNRQGRVIR